MEENNVENKETINQNGINGIIGAIIIVGVLIAGAILLRGSSAPIAQQNPTNAATNTGIPGTTTTPAPVGATDRTLGNPNAKVTLIMYEDFQCPWCGKFVSESEQVIRNNYVKNGSVELVYRDFAFLGDESVKAAEAARCAGDQGQFWQYHDYLFSHQNGEDQGAFSVANLESFAKTLGLQTTTFNQCLSTDKYATAVADSKTEGTNAGVTGTPKGFILVNGKVVSTIDGYMPLSGVTAEIDAALKQ